MENEEIKSPFVPETPEPKYDYNKHRDDTTREAIKAIYVILGENAELLAHRTEDTVDTIKVNYGKVAQKIMEVVIEHKVPDIDMKLLIENFQSTFHYLFNVIATQKNDIEREYLARSIGTRNPGNNRYSREYATLGDLFSAITKKREEQGNKKEDYEFDL